MIATASPARLPMYTVPSGPMAGEESEIGPADALHILTCGSASTLWTALNPVLPRSACIWFQSAGCNTVEPHEALSPMASTTSVQAIVLATRYSNPPAQHHRRSLRLRIARRVRPVKRVSAGAGPGHAKQAADGCAIVSGAVHSGGQGARHAAQG